MIRVVFVLLCCLVPFCLPAQAHQKKQALTTMVIKDDGSGIEIMHRFYVHDVEPVVQRLLKKSNVDFLADAEAQAAFGRYLARHFKIRLQNGEEIAIEYVGHEIDGKYFWVYQEAVNTTDGDRLEVSQKTLTDFIPDQRNLVNLETDGGVKSVYFSKDDDWKSFSP